MKESCEVMLDDVSILVIDILLGGLAEVRDYRVFVKVLIGSVLILLYVMLLQVLN